ncbi:MAG: septum site-determining protein MinC [Desulfotomaculales bacterium]
MTRELVSIKGTRDGLVIFFDPEREFEEIKRNLKHKIEAARDFFRGARFTFYQDSPSFDSLQKAELISICQQYGLVPSPHIKWPVQNHPVSRTENYKRAGLVLSSLRAGQEITSPGNLVLVGDVHPGARVFAGGDIVIMGRCRGDVHAGNPDNPKAVVVALILSPNRLTIAGTEAHLQGLSHAGSGPQMALLENEKIVFRPYLRNTR